MLYVGAAWPEVAGSIPALATKVKMFFGRPWFNYSVMRVNSELVCLLPEGICKPILFLQFKQHA